MRLMKRIALIHHTGELGGGTKSLIDIAMMLYKFYEVVICVPRGNFLEVEIKKENIIVYEMNCVPHLNLFSGSSPLLSKASLLAIKSLFRIDDFCNEIEKINPDLILFNTIVTSISSLKLQRRNCAFIDRETMTNAFYIKLYNRIINKNIRGAAFLCKYERDKFYMNKKIVSAIIPDCVSEENWSIDEDVEEELPIKSYKVLFMGGSSVLKGIDIALEAIVQLCDNILLIVAGRFDKNRFSMKNIVKHIYNPSYCRHLIKLRAAYSKAINSGNVLFVGSKSNIYPLIKKSDIVIFPSSKVHQPRPCIEAGYFNKPVIISDYMETKEYFIDGYNALTFKPNDSADLARCILYASRHRDEMAILGKHNYDMSTKFHNYEKIKNDLIAFVDKIIE